MPNLTPVRIPKAGELVASQLRRQIVVGELKAGDALPPESVLMERFGVSRPTLREAIRILEAEGLINIRRGAHGGARVQVPDPAALARHTGGILQHRGTTLKDVYEVRTLLESRAAGILAGRGRRADLGRLEDLLEVEEAAIEDGLEDKFVAADEAFHLGVVELAGSPTLELVVGVLYQIVETAIARASQSRPTPADARTLRGRTHRSHKKLVEVLRAGKPGDAEAYWQRHLTSVGKFLLEDIPAKTVLDLMS